jgi:hypothetical protein
MFATIVRVTLKDEAAAMASLTAEVVPNVKASPGFVAGYWMAPKDSKGLGVIMWQDEASAHAAVKMIKETPAEAPVTIESVNVREVAASA